MNGQVGAWAPRQPQWQHWGEDAARVHDSESATEHAAATEGAEGVDECAVACGCVEEATERAGARIADEEACMVGGWW